MDMTEAMAFVDALKKYYPRWSAGDDETDEWIRRLFRFDLAKAKKCLADIVFGDKVRNIVPPNGKIMKRLNDIATVKKQAREIKTVMTTFYIECIEPPKRNKKLLGAIRGVFAAECKDQSDPDYMLKAAEAMRGKYEEMYGGVWVIVQKEPDKPRAFGKEGRDLAFADILNGEDNKTRRWLMKYLEGQYGNMAAAIELKSVPGKVNVNNERNKQINGLQG